ncbi:hypothetical protein SH2C18_08370 [Clostridium sediminicola]|uniref:hypothetical protein n=1 Tax=Clostridium sediminicola TaxID=3114879 RepID=UPI0031F23D4D
MHINRDVYEYRIGNILFKSNQTRGTVEVYDSSGRMIRFEKNVPSNYSDFQSLAFNLFNNIDTDTRK